MEHNEAALIKKAAFAAFLGVVIIFCIMNSPIFIVKPGEVAVKYSRLSGSTKAYSQGAHFRMPIIEGIQTFDVKTLRVDVKADCASKDLQHVTVHAVLNYHLVYENVNDLFV